MTNKNTKQESAKSIVELLSKKVKKNDTPLTISVDKMEKLINDNTGIVGSIDLFINDSFVDTIVDDNPGGKEHIVLRLRMKIKPRVDKTITLSE